MDNTEDAPKPIGYCNPPGEKWKKGDPSPNPAGRAKGTLNSKTIIRKWLEAREMAKNPISGKSQKLTQLDIIALKQLEKARKGDTVAFRELLDRMEGKAKQAIEMEGGITVTTISGMEIR